MNDSQARNVAAMVASERASGATMTEATATADASGRWSETANLVLSLTTSLQAKGYTEAQIDAILSPTDWMVGARRLTALRLLAQKFGLMVAA